MTLMPEEIDTVLEFFEPSPVLLDSLVALEQDVR